MSKTQYEIIIDICSNCKQHAWCTRHNQATYFTLAQQLKKSILNHVSNATVRINLVGGQRMGSFEVACQGINLFSKLELGYFPHITLLTNRIVTFIQDAQKGSDLSRYKYSSPIKHHPTLKKQTSKSPQKTNVASNLVLLPEGKTKNNKSAISFPQQTQPQRKIQVKQISKQEQAPKHIKKALEAKVQQKKETKLSNEQKKEDSKSQLKPQPKLQLQSQPKLESEQNKQSLKENKNENQQPQNQVQHTKNLEAKAHHQEQKGKEVKQEKNQEQKPSKNIEDNHDKQPVKAQKIQQLQMQPKQEHKPEVAAISPKLQDNHSNQVKQQINEVKQAVPEVKSVETAQKDKILSDKKEEMILPKTETVETPKKEDASNSPVEAVIAAEQKKQ